MAPSILIIGATGNTGRGVTETLSKLLESSKALFGYQIIALTRSLNGAAQQFAKLSHINVIEKNWPEIDSDWLREHDVARVFIASHNQPNQFAEESTFLLAALDAGVKYVVRISTTSANVRPNCRAYYARAHWAIESMLSQPEFKNLQWTSLQPNLFTSTYLYPAVEHIKQYRKTGKQDTLKLLASADAPVGIVDPYEVGIVAAHLLSLDNTDQHNQAKYVVNGPEDITGNQIVKMVEQYIGTKVENINFKDLSFIDDIITATSSESRNVISSMKYALLTAWNGECGSNTTSKEILDIAAPKRTPAEALESMLSE